MNHIEDILNKAKEIHLKKRADYTTNPDTDPFENFTRVNELISWFPNEYKAFASHIGTKLARISSLLSTGNIPNNESLDDSFLDLVTYCALMYGFYKSKSIDKNQPTQISHTISPAMSMLEYMVSLKDKSSSGIIPSDYKTK